MKTGASDSFDRFDRLRLPAGSGPDGSSRQAGAIFGVLVMPTVVGAVEGKVKRDVETRAAGVGRLIDPVPMVI